MIPLKPVLMEAFEVSLKTEQQIGNGAMQPSGCCRNEDMQLDDVMHDDLHKIRRQRAPYERGSPARYWMRTVRDHEVYFLRAWD